MNFQKQKAEKIQNETWGLVQSLTKPNLRMSDQTRQVIFLLSINLTPEQIADMGDINLTLSSILRMRTRYKQIINCCNEFCTDEYIKHKLIEA